MSEQVVVGSSGELFDRFEWQKQAFLTTGQTHYTTRKQYLEMLLKALDHSKDELCLAVSQDFGSRSPHETKLFEIIPVTRAIRHTLKHLAGWMEPSPRPVPIWFKPARARVLPQALGVVGILSTWNYPILLTLMPLIAALSAGNRVILKLPELTPKTNAVLARMMSEIFSLQDVQVITGDSTIAEWFVSLPFNHLFFTGAAETGKKVMRAASQHLTPVTLELGGKSPAIIAPHYAVRQAVDRILTGKLMNAGQTCVAPDYVFTPQGSESLLIDQAKQFVIKHYPNLSHNTDYTAVINQSHVLRLQAMVEDAKSKGANVIPLGDEPFNRDGNKVMPCLVFDVTPDMHLMQEEIFGPLLPVMSYVNMNDVVRYINDRPRPLALYLFDNNVRRTTDVLFRTVSGGVTVNDTLWHAGVDDLPFGGVGASGMGQYHGKAGFDTFTHYKSILFQSDLSLLSLLRPPVKKWVEYLSRFL